MRITSFLFLSNSTMVADTALTASSAWGMGEGQGGIFKERGKRVEGREGGREGGIEGHSESESERHTELHVHVYTLQQAHGSAETDLTAPNQPTERQSIKYLLGKVVLDNLIHFGMRKSSTF